MDTDFETAVQGKTEVEMYEFTLLNALDTVNGKQYMVDITLRMLKKDFDIFFALSFIKEDSSKQVFDLLKSDPNVFVIKQEYKTSENGVVVQRITFHETGQKHTYTSFSVFERNTDNDLRPFEGTISAEAIKERDDLEYHQHGMQEQFHPDGSIAIEISMKFGQKQGQETHYNEHQLHIRTLKYVDDVCRERFSYDPDTGSLTSWELFTENEDVIAEGADQASYQIYCDDQSRHDNIQRLDIVVHKPSP